MSYEVFIERAREASPEAVRALAQTIASRYQLPVEAILSRLQKGRFRVKANLDRAAAAQFKAFLESVGALCSVVDASGTIVDRSAALNVPAPARPTAPRPPARASSDESFAAEDSGEFLSLLTPPPPAAPTEVVAPSSSQQYSSPLAGITAPSGQTSSSPLGAIGSRAASDAYESGLSAATAGSQQDLGVLGGGDAEGFQLSALDHARGGSSSAEPEPSRAVAVTEDVAFLPPDMVEEKAMELAVDLPEKTPVPVVQRPVTQERSAPVPAAFEPDEAGPAKKQSILVTLARQDRVRFAVGVAFAIVVGFLPAHFVASSQEDSKYETVHKDLRAAYAEADTEERWNELDADRATASDLLESRQRNILVTALVIWMVVGGGLAFLWFRKIDWDKLARSA